MKIKLIFGLFVISLILISGCSKEQSTSYDLIKVYSFIDKEPSVDDTNIIKLNLNKNDCELRKLSTIILYKYDENYKDYLSKEFKIEENSNNKNLITNDEVIQTIKRIESQHPNYNSSIILFYTFCEFKDKNLWVDINGEKISLAKFFGGTIFGNILNQSEKDFIKLVNEEAETNNISLCEKYDITDVTNRTICYTMVGIELKDTSVCENLKEEQNIDFCYTNIIERGEGFSICDKLEEENKAKCIGYGVLLMLASGECEKEKENSKELCYELSAERLKEASLCNKVYEKHIGLCDRY